MCEIIAALLSVIGLVQCEPPVSVLPQPQPEVEILTPSQPAPSEPIRTAPVKCQVNVDGGAHRTITAVAMAGQRAQSGTFALDVEKKGENTARSRQRGEFALVPGETKRLAVMKVNVGAGDMLAGHLSLNWDGGETTCSIK